jgi:hypothetical protein
MEEQTLAQTLQLNTVSYHASRISDQLIKSFSRLFEIVKHFIGT